MVSNKFGRDCASCTKCSDYIPTTKKITKEVSSFSFQQNSLLLMNPKQKKNNKSQTKKLKLVNLKIKIFFLNIRNFFIATEALNDVSKLGYFLVKIKYF